MIIKHIKNLRNIIDFFFRKNIRFSRKYHGKNELKDNLFSYLSIAKISIATIKEQEYLKKYNLENLKNNSTKRLYLENLAIIELLESCLLNDIQKNNIKILDIGSKNWFYAYGEHHFFKYANFEKDIFLNGIELDAFRMYSNLYSRYDYANYHIRNLDKTEYIAGNLLNLKEKYNFITWFFPFVTESPLIEWGLPLSEFKPELMLNHAYNLLEPNGIIFIVNQDQKEYSIQSKILDTLNIPFEPKGCFESSFIEYEHKRFLTIIRKIN